MLIKVFSFLVCFVLQHAILVLLQGKSKTLNEWSIKTLSRQVKHVNRQDLILSTSKIPLANGKSLCRTCKIIGTPVKNGNQLKKNWIIWADIASLRENSAYSRIIVIRTTKWMSPQQQSLVWQCWKFLKSCDKD